MSVHIFKAKSGKYGLRIYHNGNQREKIVGSKATAQRLKKQVEYQIAAKRLGIADDVPTFGEYSKKYLEFVSLRRSPGTYRRYASLNRMYLNKHFGKTRLDQINRGNVRDMLLKEYKKGASRSSIELMHTVLSGVFNFALDDELIQSIPTIGILRRLDFKREKREVKPLTVAESEAVLLNVKDQHRTFFTLLFETGLRIGEALALDWGDVNFFSNEISVNKTAKDQTVRPFTKNYMNRKVDISKTLLPALKKHDAIDKKTIVRLGIERKYVFHTNGRIVAENTLRRDFVRSCRKAGISHHTPHDCRHSWASWHLMSGTPLTYVSKKLGHSNPHITLTRYAHYIPEQNNDFINNIKRDKIEKINSGQAQV